MKKNLVLLGTLAALVLPLRLAAAELDAAQQGKISEQLKAVQALAATPALVEAVKAQNASTPADYSAMTQDKWKGLTVLDPFVRAFTKNPAGVLLKSKKTEAVSEAFLSDASGLKVAFLSKPSNWSHKGKAKHDDPMAGKTWQGPVEVDESSGVQQVQVAVPILDGGKPIGSLVVGISLSKL
jgi:hypothetical protein